MGTLNTWLERFLHRRLRDLSCDCTAGEFHPGGQSAPITVSGDAGKAGLEGVHVSEEEGGDGVVSVSVRGEIGGTGFGGCAGAAGAPRHHVAVRAGCLP